MSRVVIVLAFDLDEEVATLDTVPALARQVAEKVLPEFTADGASNGAMYAAIHEDAEKVLAVFDP